MSGNSEPSLSGSVDRPRRLKKYRGTGAPWRAGGSAWNLSVGNADGSWSHLPAAAARRMLPGCHFACPKGGQTPQILLDFEHKQMLALGVGADQSFIVSSPVPAYREPAWYVRPKSDEALSVYPSRCGR